MKLTIHPRLLNSILCQMQAQFVHMMKLPKKKLVTKVTTAIILWAWGKEGNCQGRLDGDTIAFQSIWQPPMTMTCLTDLTLWQQPPNAQTVTSFFLADQISDHTIFA
jgi:hypothetical protein